MKGLDVTICLYLICHVCQSLLTNSKIDYTGSQVWKVTHNRKSALELLGRLENDEYVSLWGLNSDTVDVMVKAQFVDQIRDKILANNLTYKVITNDLQKAIEEENPQEALDARQGYQMTWSYYHSLADIHGYLEHLKVTFPRLCTVHTIGQSVEGRPIKLLKLSNGKSGNKAIFIEGGIHAREWISPATVTYIIHQLVYGNEPSATKELDWYFLPVLNPDGYEYSYDVDRLWRKNRADVGTCRGVDLNRNWGYYWATNGSSKDPCKNTFRGSKPFSEPETVAVANFILNNPSVVWKGYIAVHSYGQYIVYPWGSSNDTIDDADELDALARKAASKIMSKGGANYTVGPTSTTIYRASGSSVDWARGVHDIKYSYTIELRDKGQHGFILPAQFIRATGEEALIFIRAVAEVALI